MSYKNFIIQSLKEAAIIANKNFGKIIEQTKKIDNNQVVTKTDLDIGNLLTSKIQQYFPDHNIIDEEIGIINNKSSLTWVIDPIDGTSNFANALPMYGIMIGLLKDDLPVAGGIILPSFNEIYFAEKGRGAFCNDKQIHVTDKTNLKEVLLVYAMDGRQENPQLTYKECQLLAEIMLNIRNHRSSNSCYDIMMMAKGKYGGWLNRTTKIWDNVAPQIIIEEAGGKYTDFIGKKIDYSNPVSKTDKNFTVCAAPPLLHQELQEIIKKHNQLSTSGVE